jgi:hypothetical protein
MAVDGGRLEWLQQTLWLLPLLSCPLLYIWSSELEVNAQQSYTHDVVARQQVMAT